MKVIRMNVKKILKGIRVSNMESSRGNEIPNQFIIRTDDATIFQSYSTIIVVRTQGKTYLDKDSWAYSTTTGKYRNIFLGEDKKATERKIKSGEYILTKLNE